MRIAGKATLYLRRQRFGDISKHSLVRRDAEPAPVKSTSSMTGATLPRASVRMSVWRSYVFAHATEM